MKTLNLVDLDKSDIKYLHQKFPDGQQNIVLTHELYISTGTSRMEGYEEKRKIETKYPIQIKSRLNNWLDLELIVASVASLRELGVKEIHLYTPYIMGARSDRKFEEGGNNYLRDVLCPIINSLNFKTVTCIDPHSYSLECCIKNFKSVDNSQLVKFALENLTKIYTTHEEYNLKNDFILISPDAGASKKIYKLAEQIGYKGDIITCSKERDKDGKLSRTNVPEFDLSKDVIIIDDIFDYGRTFTNIAREITNRSCKGKLYLIVTHSIQEEGLEEALTYFDAIYTTNSYKNHNINRLKQLNVF